MIASRIVKWGLLFIAMVLVFGCVHGNAISDHNAYLVAYYPFDGDANDGSGNNNHGRLFGDVALTEDRSGNPNGAYRFDGIGNGIGYSDRRGRLGCSARTGGSESIGGGFVGSHQS